MRERRPISPLFADGWFVLAFRLVGVFALVGMVTTVGAIGFGLWWLLS